MIELAPGAENNAFATMLADLLKQNLESKPHKKADFDALRGSVALIADDAEVALTLSFGGGHLVVHDGIKDRPDVAVRGTADAIMAMSNVPLTGPLALPLPTDAASLDVMKEMVRAMRAGELKVHGMLGNFGFLSKLTRVMSVNG
ncbi:MAG: hypothetical protein U0270_08345 [Labilithrix sp.]